MASDRQTPESFEQRFGEVRSLVSSSSWDEERAAQLWEQMFEMANQDRARLLAEVVPYVRSTGFFDEALPIPMFEEPWHAYKFPDCVAHQEAHVYDGDDFASYLCYGWVVDAQAFALLGDPSNWKGEERTSIHLIIPSDKYSKGYEGKVIAGIEAESIMAQDISLADKKAACQEALERSFQHVEDALGEVTGPAFYLFGDGFKIWTRIVIGKTPLEEEECEEAEGRGLDVFHEHDRYDQDYEFEAPMYSGASIKALHGSAGINEISFSEQDEERALARLKSAGVERPSRRYVLVNHM